MRDPLVVDGRNFLDREALRRGRLHLRGHRPAGERHAGAGPRGRRGHAAAAAHLHDAEAGDAARRAARSCRSCSTGCARHGVDEVILSCGFMSDAVERVLGDIYDGMRLRYVVEERAARHRRPGAARARRGPARGAAARPERRRAHRHGPHRRARRSTSAPARARRSRSDRGRRHGELRRRADRRRRAGRGVPREGARASRRRTASTPARTCSSATVDRARSRRAAPCRSSARSSRSSWATGCTATLAAGYWIDIGTPERYLEATWDLLAGASTRTLPAARRDRLARLRGLPAGGAHIGPQSVLGRHCSVGTDSRVERSVLHDRVRGRARTPPCASASRRAACGWATAPQVEPGRDGRSAARVIGAGAVDRRRTRGWSRATEVAERARRSTGRAIERRRPAAGCSATSSPSRTSSATRSGAPSRRASAPADAPGGLVVCGMGGSAIGGDLARGRDRRPRHAADHRSSRGYALDVVDRGRTRSSCARATRARPRRRSPASRRPASAARRASC